MHAALGVYRLYCGERSTVRQFGVKPHHVTHARARDVNVTEVVSWAHHSREHQLLLNYLINYLVLGGLAIPFCSSWVQESMESQSFLVSFWGIFCQLRLMDKREEMVCGFVTDRIQGGNNLFVFTEFKCLPYLIQLTVMFL